MLFTENRIVFQTLQEEKLVETPVGTSENVGTLFRRDKPDAPIVEQAVTEAEKTPTQAEKERQEILLREEARVAQAPERRREILTDAQQQAEAARLRRAERREKLTARETGAIIAPIQTRAAADIGVRGGFTSGAVPTDSEAARELVEQRVGQDPEIRRLSAIESGNIERINTIQEKIRQTRVGDAKALDDLKADLEDLNADLKSSEQEKAVASIDSFIDTIGVEEFGKLKADALTSYVESLTDDPGTLQSVLARQSIAKQIAETKDEEQKATLLDTFNRLGIAPSARVQEAGALQLLQGELDAGTITQSTFDRLSGIISGGGRSTTTSTGKNVFAPTGKYGVNILPESSGKGGSIAIDIEDGEKAGQCGRFVNDALGTPSLFGDTFESKAANINSKTPIAGAAFVMATGSTWGHCGIVERVHEDGSIDIVESNLNNRTAPETISRRTIKISNADQNPLIAGYYVPPEVNRADNPALQQFIDRHKLAGTPSAKDAIVDEVVAANLLPEFIAATEIPTEFVEGVIRSASGLPQKIRDSKEEMARFEKVAIKELKNGTDPLDIADIFQGFKISDLKPEDQGLAKNLRLFATNTNLEIADIGRLVNNEKFETAMVNVENERISASDPNLINAKNVRETVLKANKALKLLSETDPGLLGVFDAQEFKFTERPTGGITKEGKRRIQKAVDLQAALVDVVSPYRVENIGSQITEAELNLIEPLLSAISDQPATIETKLNALKRALVSTHNAHRLNVGLPTVNEVEVIDNRERLNKYRGEKTTQPAGEVKNIKPASPSSIYLDTVTDEVNDAVSNYLNTLGL